VVALSVAACSDDGEHADAATFCAVASSAHVARLDLTDPEVLADARPDLARLRTVAPATLRHDLSRLLDSDDPGVDLDDLQAAATRLRRSVEEACQ
jgi:hypothetical protein